MNLDFLGPIMAKIWGNKNLGPINLKTIKGLCAGFTKWVRRACLAY